MTNGGRSSLVIGIWSLAIPRFPHFPLAKWAALGHADECESSLFTSARIRGCIVVETGSDADGQSWPLVPGRLLSATRRVLRAAPIVTPLLCLISICHRFGNCPAG